MKVLVTGADGFIGSRLCTALEKRGHWVVRFVQSAGMNLRDAGAVRRAMQGVDVVCHLGAVLDEHSKELFDVNVGGTKNVVEACAAAKVGQLVFLSTTGVMGSSAVAVDESASYKPLTAYERSKAEAEEIVLAYQEAVPVTVVRSALVYGANSYWLGIAKLVRRGFPLVGRGGNSWQMVYVDDIVDAIVFVLGKEEAFGEVFVVAEKEAHSLKEVCVALAKELGVEAPKRSVPAWAGIALAYVFAAKSMLTGKKTLVTPAHVKRLLRERKYNTAKINALGWSAGVELKDGMARAVAEFKKNGLI